MKTNFCIPKIYAFLVMLLFFTLFLSFNASALSIVIHIPEKYTDVIAGDRIYFETEIKYPENPTRQDLRLEYEIKNEKDQVIANSKVLKAIETQASFIDFIVIPKIAESGLYTINVKIKDYADLSEEVSASFRITQDKTDRIKLYFFILLGVITFVGILVVINNIKTKNRKKKVDIAKEFSENQTVLLLVPSTEYNDVILSTVKKLSNESVGYVTLNKTFESLKETFSKKGVNLKNIVFVDAITRTIKGAKDTDSCYFVNSPEALPELSLTISKFLKHDFKYIIFDSITNLLIYSKKAPVAMFLSKLINKVKASKTKAVFYALSMDEQDDLIKESSIFVDKVVDLGEKQ